MISEKIQNLFRFIEYLHPKIETFNSNSIEVIAVLYLRKKAGKLHPNKTLTDKKLHDKIRKQINDLDSIVLKNIRLPIRQMVIDLNLRELDNNYGLYWNDVSTDIHILKDKIELKDEKVIESFLKLYVAFRMNTKISMKPVQFLFDEMDNILKPLFEFLSLSTELELLKLNVETNDRNNLLLENANVMDYLKILLEGYCDTNTRSFFKDYLLREFKKAEKEHFSFEEVFCGFQDALTRLKNECERDYYVHLEELQFTLHHLQNGGKHELIEGLTLEQLIVDVKRDIEALKKDEFGVVLNKFTNGMFNGDLTHNEVSYMFFKLGEAYLSYKKESEMPLTSENTVESIENQSKVVLEIDNCIFTDYGKALFERYIDSCNVKNNHRTEFRFLFDALKRDNLLHPNTSLKHYIDYITERYDYVSDELKRISWDAKPNQKRIATYELIKKYYSTC